MEINSEELLQDLTGRTKEVLAEAEMFKIRSTEDLNWRPAPKKWSVLECLEHLSLYGDFYLPEIEKVIRLSKFPAEPTFKSGLLGNYFANMMLPRERMGKMRTFKDKNPLGSQLDKSTLGRFIEQQHKILELLQEASQKDLTRTKTGTSISGYIQLKLGDTFRVVVFHNQRHIAQAKNVLVQKDKLKHSYFSREGDLAQQE